LHPGFAGIANEKAPAVRGFFSRLMLEIAGLAGPTNAAAVHFYRDFSIIFPGDGLASRANLLRPVAMH
jgi:hypothetical protein